MIFEEFVAARLSALLRYATVLTCDPHLAEDVVQDVLLRLQPRWDRIDAMAQPEAYVKRAILNETLAWRRGRWAKVLLMRGETLPEEPAPEPDRDDREILLRLIADLPPKQRVVLVLRFYEGLSDAEIADLLDCGQAAVRSNSSRAVASLRAALARSDRPMEAST